MLDTIKRNKSYLTDLFSGMGHGSAIVMDAPFTGPPAVGDYTLSREPVKQWVPWAIQNYENKVKWLRQIDDDSVPYVNTVTNTAIFAAAFGCPLHEYGDSNACARPIVYTAEEADKIKVPDLDAPVLNRILELAGWVREELGEDVPVSLPDIQSAFDVAALIWNKEEFFIALFENPDAVMRLVDKCHILIKMFISEFKRRFPNGNLGHTVNIWTPAELGCCVTEDEAGNISSATFKKFCLPNLIDLSETFGGVFLHSCANADHQHENFMKVPNLRGINRVIRGQHGQPFYFDPVRSIRDFGEKTVRIVAWVDLEGVLELLKLAEPGTRFLIEMGYQPPEQAKRTYAILREHCPRG